MMVEAEAIASALGVKFPIDVDKRIAGAAYVGAHKTSMLQDLELGRPMEIDALVTAVQELGRLTRRGHAGDRHSSLPSCASARGSRGAIPADPGACFLRRQWNGFRVPPFCRAGS